LRESIKMAPLSTWESNEILISDIGPFLRKLMNWKKTEQPRDAARSRVKALVRCLMLYKIVAHRLTLWSHSLHT
jgi:hypothetical protein